MVTSDHSGDAQVSEVATSHDRQLREETVELYVVDLGVSIPAKPIHYFGSMS